MNDPQLISNKRYNYADYLTWIDDRRWEIYNGSVRLMPRTSLRVHQEILGNLVGILGNYLLDKEYKTDN